MRPLVLGVTGCVGAGKSTACAELTRRGWAVVDVDDLVRGILAGRGIDRRRLLAETVADRAAFARWVTAIGPEVIGRVRGWIDGLDGPGAIEAALLFEVGLDRLCDLTLCVRCPVEERRRRVEARATASAELFDAIDAAQWPEARKAARADGALWPGEPVDLAIRRAQRSWVGRRCGEAVLDRYEEPHRAYHTLSHIAACLRELDDAPLGEADKAVLVKAIALHDAVYAPLAADNEERSAALTSDPRVAALVRATKDHAVTADPLSAWLIDIDLAILAAGKRDFEAYEAGIRTEYAMVPEVIYRQRRREVLQGFLDRPSIYLTAWGRARYEKKARSNLRRCPTPDARRPISDP